MTEQVLERIRGLLTCEGVVDLPITDAYVPRGMIRVRGESLAVEQKSGSYSRAMMCLDCSCCLRDRQLDAKRVKQQLAVRSVWFATTEELLELTGLVPGAVPPFGARCCRLSCMAMRRSAAWKTKSRSTRVN